MDEGIENLLSDEPAPQEAEAAETPTPEPEAEAPAEAEGQPRDESGRFASKQTGEEPQVAAEATPANPIPEDQFKGYLTEKRKRQELEQQVAEMQSRFEQFQAQARSPQAEPPVDFWDDPQAVMARQIEQGVARALQAEKQQQTMERINASELQAKARHDDYEDAFRAFQQAATANPSLIQRMTSESDPAEFAYKTGKVAIDLEKVGSMDELLKSERAKWEAELRAAVPAPQSFPATTATDGSVGARSGPAFSPPSIDQLLA